MRDGFDFQPTLTGEKLTMRPLREDDFDQLYAVASDPLLWQGHPAKNRYLKPEFEAFFADAIASKGALLALDRKSGETIGSSRLFPYENHNDQVEIGWSFLARSHWGGAYNGEMKRLMMDHIFKTYGQVFFRVDHANIRSQKAVLKIGAIQTGVHEDGLGAKWFHYRCDRDS